MNTAPGAHPGDTIEEAHMADRYFAHRAMQYGEAYLEQGQVVELAGLDNDAKWVATGALIPVSAQTQVVSCAVCGQAFSKQKLLKRHNKRVHVPQEYAAYATA
jgi:hypothetical protein